MIENVENMRSSIFLKLERDKIFFENRGVDKKI